MAIKRVLRPDRLRRIPEQFSWVDQKLVREGYCSRCEAGSLALYLFLVTVADHEGLSYYGDETLARHLALAPAQLAQARHELIRVGLIAYSRPLYQVLSLDPPSPPRIPSMQAVKSGLERLQTRLEPLKYASHAS